jgi:hypothetical protein
MQQGVAQIMDAAIRLEELSLRAVAVRLRA